MTFKLISTSVENLRSQKNRRNLKDCQVYAQRAKRQHKICF